MTTLNIWAAATSPKDRRGRAGAGPAPARASLRRHSICLVNTKRSVGRCSRATSRSLQGPWTVSTWHRSLAGARAEPPAKFVCDRRRRRGWGSGRGERRRRRHAIGVMTFGRRSKSAGLCARARASRDVVSRARNIAHYTAT